MGRQISVHKSLQHVHKQTGVFPGSLPFRITYKNRDFLSPCIAKASVLMFQISCIENLNHLSELRVLNLAGNQITTVDNLTGIDALAELNLRRNKIRTVVSRSRLWECPLLPCLWICFRLCVWVGSLSPFLCSHDVM